MISLRLFPKRRRMDQLVFYNCLSLLISNLFINFIIYFLIYSRRVIGATFQSYLSYFSKAKVPSPFSFS